VTTRRLTEAQQRWAEAAVPVIPLVIAAFCRRQAHSNILAVCDLQGAAQAAVCVAALTYDPEKAGISAYFSVAIQRALTKELVARQRQNRRMQSHWDVQPKPTNPHHDRMKARASKALQFLDPYDRELLEDHLIEGVTLERLGREQDLDKRTIKKRIQRAIVRLRDAESHLP
jgi:RNA polymerase sigma factor (sigma-70 family)